jgi:hypothetical protein
VTKELQYANAFVIQLRAIGAISGDQLPGRVEHVASGRTATFLSVEELPQLLLRMLKSMTSNDQQEIG